MPSKKPSLAIRAANFIAQFSPEARRKEFVRPLSPLDGWSLNGTGRLKQYITRPEQLEANLGWVFAANTAIVEPAAAVEFKLYRKKKDGDREEIKEHQILDLLNDPNAAHTGEQLRQLHYTYMNLTGEGYWLMLKGGRPFTPKRGELPDAVQVLPTHRLKFKLGAIYSDSTIEIDKKVFSVKEVLRDINPDPANPYYGRSIIAAAAQALDLEYQMMQWNRRTFANSARPSLIFKTNEQLDDKVYERWKQQFVDEHTGSENAGKPLLIESGDVTPLMIKHSELEFLKSREFSMKEILSMFKVSPGMLGQVENVNRANLEAGFYIHSVINTLPRVRQLTNQINQTIVKVYDPELELDFVNPVPEDVELKLKEAKEGVDKWLTKDEVRDMWGEKPLPNGQGTHIIVTGATPTTLESITGATSGEDDEGTGGTTPPATEDPSGLEGDDVQRSVKKNGQSSDDQVDEDREARGNAKVKLYLQRGELYESSLVTVLHELFQVQREEILSKAYAGELVKSLTSVPQARRKAEKRDWLDALLDWAAADDDMKDALAPILYALMVETGQDAMREIGLEPSQFDAADLAVLTFSQERAAQVAHEINAETAKQLRASLSQGIDLEETDDQLRARVEAVMGAALTYRTARIAASETTRAQSHADVAAWRQAGTVSGKEWFTAEDERVCRWCNNMDGAIVDLDSDFYQDGDVLRVDGHTMTISYEDAGDPPLHVSCRCRLLPVTKQL